MGIGEPLIYEGEGGELHSGEYRGWNLQGDIPMIKIHSHQTLFTISVSISSDKVWRPFDAKDEYIEILEKKLIETSILLGHVLTPDTSHSQTT